MTETVPPSSLGVGFWVSIIAAITLASLWENPPDGRSPRQRLGGIFHRLRAALRFWFFLLIHDAIQLWQRPMYWLHCKDGLDGYPLVPMWLVNLPYGSLPESWKKEILQAWKRRHDIDGLKAKNNGGQS